MKKKIHSNRLTALYERSNSRKAYLKSYIGYLTALLAGLDYQMISKVAECFLRARTRGATIFFIGNGGSAATASHFAQDLGEVGRKTKTAPFRAISLCESVPFMTALGNDYGFDRIFADQLNNLFKKGDILVAISASGNSPNIVETVKLAKKKKGITVGLVGFDGGKLAKISDFVIHIKTKYGEYGPVEDAHMILDHMITTYFCLRLSRQRHR